MIGQTVSQFRIVSELGSGGMGVVYRAEDTRLDRTVALKFLPPHLTADESARARFIHEAKSASSLEHPAICSIFEIGETDDGHTFMVMPCYEGQTLAERLEDGPLAVDEAVEIFRQTAQGLAKAHSQGIVHRDIKPANIFLTDDGQAKILDFGLAKLAGQTQLTAEGTTLGTVAYMSPEQARGEEVTERSDIWSLGAVLYEMLGGKPAFGGDNPHAVMYAIQQAEPVSLGETRADLPVDTMALVSGMLEKDPEQRVDWESGQLSSILGDPALFRARQEEIPWYRGWMAVSGGILGVVLVSLILIRFLAPQGAITAIAVLPFENISGDEDQEYYADGMTGQLISKLGALRVFDRVISRRSVMQYKGESMPLAEIGADLNVQAVVEGSVMLMGDRVQVTAFLLDAARDKQLWTETFDEPVANIMNIQGRIVTAIAQAVRLELDPGAQARLREMGTVNPVAHKTCMRGYDWLVNSGSEEEWALAGKYFNEAIAADSTFALAHAGLAEWLVRSTHNSEGPPPGMLDRARASVDRAIELDPELAEAHITRGHLLWEHLYEIEEGGRSIERAIELNPSLAYAYGMQAYYFETLGRDEESAAAARKTIELDPESLFMNAVIIEPLGMAGKYDEALAQVDNTREKFPSYEGWRRHKFYVFNWQGKLEEALPLYEEIKPEDRTPSDKEDMIEILTGLDRMDDARKIFKDYRAEAEKDSLFASLSRLAFALGDTAASLAYLEQLEKVEPQSIMWLIPLHAMHGNFDQAFVYLEEAYDRKFNWMTRLGVFPKMGTVWAALAEDPRYEELMRKIGIRE